MYGLWHGEECLSPVSQSFRIVILQYSVHKLSAAYGTAAAGHGVPAVFHIARYIYGLPTQICLNFTAVGGKLNPVFKIGTHSSEQMVVGHKPPFCHLSRADSAAQSVFGTGLTAGGVSSPTLSKKLSKAFFSSFVRGEAALFD